jgi:hypothetical protein
MALLGAGLVAFGIIRRRDRPVAWSWPRSRRAQPAGPAIGLARPPRKPGVTLCKKLRHLAGLDLAAPRAAPFRTTPAAKPLSRFGFAAYGTDREETVLDIMRNEIDAALLGSR